MKPLLAILILAAISASIRAQSFNVDMEINAGPGTSGRGVPNSAFGAAGNSPGFWNNIDATGFGTHFLRGLDGNLTSARIVGPQGGGGGSSNLPQNTGNYAALLNDARGVGIAGSVLTFRLDGLTNGQYKLYTYAVSIAVPSEFVVARVTCPQASWPVQESTGPMPGNVLIEGTTHTAHELTVSSNQITVSIESVGGMTWFNGLQLVSVPEPTTFAGLSSLLLLRLCRKRGRRKTSQPME